MTSLFKKNNTLINTIEAASYINPLQGIGYIVG
jgi:hypothetical protein